MRTVDIKLIGCDDTTYFTLCVDDREFEFLKMLERVSDEKSEYCCQPVLRVKEVGE